MIEQLFEVATEFRFDVGQALINTHALQDGIDQVSQSANSALRSINFLASGLVAKLGFGSGGLLSVLSKAVELSEQFDTNALSLSNNISSNIGVLAGTINTFNDRLNTSQMLLDNISNTAIKFTLPTGDLARITTLIATPLAMRGKLGMNYGNAIEMSKNVMLGAQATGVNQHMAAESLYRALSERMPLHGALFSRLANTPEFKKAHVINQGQLQTMNQDKKIDLLDRALKSLAMDSDALAFRLKSLHTQFTIIMDQIEIVLKPIGDAIRKPLVLALGWVNDYLKVNGKLIGESIGKLLGNLIEDPKKLLINLMQLKSFGGDFKKSLHLVELYGTFKFLKYILAEVLGITLNGGLIRAAFAYIYEGIMFLAALVPWGKILSGVFNLLRVAAAEILPLFASFLFFFQIISRARAIAKVADIQNLLTLTPKFTAVLVKMKTAFENIMLPINMAIDFWAKLIAPLFETSTWLMILLPILEGFASVMDVLGKATVYALAGLSGITMLLIGFVDDIIHLKNPFGQAAGNFKEGFDSFLKDNQARLGGEQMKATANYVTNVGKIEARFDMREQLEPDRIAFAVTDKLKQLASNPRQGRGTTLNAAFSGAYAFAGNK